MSDLAIGSIQQSLLSQAQFQAVMGTTDWVLANGQGVSGSQYNMITGNANVPNLKGCYIRMAGGNSGGVGQIQEESVDVTNLSASTQIGGTDVSIGGTSVTTSGNSNQLNNKGGLKTASVSASFFLKYSSMYTKSLTGTAWTFKAINSSSIQGSNTSYPVSAPDHSHTLNLSGNFTMSGTTATESRTTSTATRSASITGYDSTTEPTHLVLNYFIKIN